MAAPPTETEAPADAGTDVEEEPSCPRCGTPYEALQEYCLECGLRLPVDERLRTAVVAAWDRRLPWYAGEWLWPVLVAFVVALVATVASVAAVRVADDADEERIVATQPEPESVPVTATAEPEPETTPTPTLTQPETEAERPPPPRPARRGALTAWPRNRNGYTVVLASVPKRAGRASALGRARRAARAGLEQVGVIDSDQYGSFTPGFYVVFAGVHASLAAAERGRVAAHTLGYDDAYAKPVTR